MAELSKINFAKLNNDNYFTWKYKMELFLLREKAWYVIKDDKPVLQAEPTVQERRELKDFEDKDDQARGAIGLSVEDSQLRHIRSKKTAKEMWTVLKEHHERDTLGNKVSLMRKICRMKMPENGNVESHLNEMANLFQKLNDFGDNLTESWTVAIVLSSLPPSYDTLITALEARPEGDLTMSYIQTKLISEYTRRKGDSPESNSDSILKTQQKLRCFFCKKDNHIKKDCMKYKQWKEKHESFNGTKGKSSDKAHKVEHGNEFLFQISSKGNNGWIIDSGATSHVTNDKRLLETLNTDKSSDVDMANGNKECVKGKGTCKVQMMNESGDISNAKLTSVLYAPQITGNMISVSKLTDSGFELRFKNDCCEIMNNNIKIALADKINGLYKLRQPNKVYACKEDKHTTNCIHFWHKVFGHRDPAAIKEMYSKNMVNGMKIIDCGIKTECETCLQAKSTRLPFPRQSSSQSNDVLELVHSDVCGPMQTQSPSGKRYVLTFIDDYSHYTVIYLLRKKSEVEEKIKEYIALVMNKFGKKIKCMRSDRGGEYMGHAVKNYLSLKGISVQYTAPYSPQQNGVAERKNRTLIEMARCMLHEADLPFTFWAEAVNTANYIQNRVITRSTNQIPFHLWNGKKPGTSHFQIFGSKCFVHVPKEKRRKLDNTAQPMIFMGYDENSKAYRCYDSIAKKLVISRDVRFLSNELHGGAYVEKMRQPVEVMIEDNLNDSFNQSDTSGSTLQAQSSPDSIGSNQSNLDTSWRDTTIDNDSSEDEGSEFFPSAGDITDSDAAFSPVVLRRPRLKAAHRANVIYSIIEPKTLSEALECTDKDKWVGAMNDEILSLKKNRTWSLCELPADRKAIGCKWVFKIKTDEKGNALRYKARLVAQGYLQKFGTDYDQVFAPVARQTTFRVFLTMASMKNYLVHHFDAKTAFLNGNLNEIIFMKQPPGYGSENKDLVCHLKKSLYGLKQAAKSWNDEINKTLFELGFTQSKADACLYSKRINNNWCFILIYVDDILIAAESIKVVKEIKDKISLKFDIDDLGEIKHYLGIEIMKEADGFYSLNQSGYINKITHEFGLSDAKISNVPIQVNYGKDVAKGDDGLLTSNMQYQRLIGCLLYISVNTRPDIAAGVSILAQKVSQPRIEDWNELKRIVKYLKGTSNIKLVLGKTNEHELIYGYADANFAENKSDRKSNGGYVFILNGGVISWTCRKQSCVSLSSTEAEFIALSEACKEALWLRRVLADMKIDINEPIKIYEDNQSCLKLIVDEKLSNRTKHIDTRYHFVKDHIDKKLVACVFCPSEEMLADLFTKPLPVSKFEKLRNTFLRY